MNGIALQFTVKNWPSCHASLKCGAISCDAFWILFRPIGLCNNY